ncbi:hypothetical protein [Poseidonibacter ostreae]|uniref:Capsular biosynthesis protein n=1 Tax=Poseidonibacter ostreae TaxID=2654171 RepID=A0A6L4WU63_9BACT|nr:hypothetical protein [Poseidonibacter ostreae]KAB7889777.1 hypothetical protein GBG19_05190 [Poseidonibacter ostreae]
MKNSLLSGFQISYINEIIKQCDFLTVKSAIYIEDGENRPDLELLFDRNELRAGNVIEDKLYFHYDSDVVLKVQPYLLNALTLFDRYDVNNSISSTERLRIIYLNVAFWIDYINQEKIELILSREIPHFPHEYCLYIASKVLGVKILMFDYVEHLKRTLCIESIEDRFIASKDVLQDLILKSEKLLRVLKSSYDEVLQNSKVPTISTFKTKWSFVSWCKYFTRDILSVLKYRFSRSPISILLDKKQYLLREKPFHYKVRFFFHKLRYKVFLYELFYISKSKSFNIDNFKDNKLVVFYANYQPERTTNPDGGVYFDILNVLSLLKNLLPNEYKIIYKEHPHTFSPPYKDLFRGALFRSKEYYQKIIDMGVELVPTSFNTYKLIELSDFSASINGTVLIESIVNKTNAIMFGNGWIESLPGVYKIKNRQDLINLLNQEQVSEINEKDVVKKFADVYSDSIEHLNLLKDWRSFNTIHFEVEQLLKYVKDKSGK